VGRKSTKMRGDELIKIEGGLATKTTKAAGTQGGLGHFPLPHALVCRGEPGIWHVVVVVRL